MHIQPWFCCIRIVKCPHNLICLNTSQCKLGRGEIFGRQVIDGERASIGVVRLYSLPPHTVTFLLSESRHSGWLPRNIAFFYCHLCFPHHDRHLPSNPQTTNHICLNCTLNDSLLRLYPVIFFSICNIHEKNNKQNFSIKTVAHTR